MTSIRKSRTAKRESLKHKSTDKKGKSKTNTVLWLKTRRICGLDVIVRLIADHILWINLNRSLVTCLKQTLIFLHKQLFPGDKIKVILILKMPAYFTEMTPRLTSAGCQIIREIFREGTLLHLWKTKSYKIHLWADVVDHRQALQLKNRLIPKQKIKMLHKDKYH